MGKRLASVLLSLFLTSAFNMYSYISEKEYWALPEKQVNTVLDTGQIISFNVETIKNNPWYKHQVQGYYGHDETYKYKLNGQKPGERMTITYYRDVTRMNEYSTYRAKFQNLTNNFENVRNMTVNPLKYKQLGCTIALIGAALFAEYKLFKQANTNPNRSFRYTCGLSGLVAALIVHDTFQEKIDFYNKITEEKYLNTRNKNNSSDEFDSLAREIPNPIITSDIVTAGVASAVTAAATFFIYNHFLRKK